MLKKSPFSDKSHEPYAWEIYNDISKTEKSQADNDKNGDYEFENIGFTECRFELGFGLLCAGSVSTKAQANIMYKNAIDVVFGGISYWLFGYAFRYYTCTSLTRVPRKRPNELQDIQIGPLLAHRQPPCCLHGIAH